ncbi:hypothetical protein ACFXPZ_10740 [Streptomyces sp. NPDC059101]|uniref:hypothetical protein n=1 Tax=unclassified Streptomyces TaxID=2593676 RepID=UPI0036939B2C
MNAEPSGSRSVAQVSYVTNVRSGHRVCSRASWPPGSTRASETESAAGPLPSS